MIKDFFLRKMLEKQMKGIPKEEQDKLINIIIKNPELFQKMGVEIKAKMDNEKMDQMRAVQEVSKKYEAQLKSLHESM